MPSPLVTILINLYNKEKYLSRCFDTVINQTYKNLEILVINDGSTDSSGQMVSEYAKKDKRIVIYNQENHGLTYSRKLGLSLAKGDYIWIVDPDDYIELDAVEILVNTLVKNKTDGVYLGFNMIYEKENRNEIITYPKQDKVDNIEIFEKVILRKMMNQAAMFMFSRRLVDIVEMPLDCKYIEDMATAYKVLYECKNGISIVDKPLYNYLIYEDGLSYKMLEYKRLYYYSKIRIEQYIYASEKNTRKEVLDEMLKDVAKRALYIYHNSFLEKDRHQYAYNFLMDNKKDVLRLQGISKMYKLRYWMFYNCRFLYDVIIRIKNDQNN